MIYDYCLFYMVQMPYSACPETITSSTKVDEYRWRPLEAPRTDLSLKLREQATKNEGKTQETKRQR
jgi:hypothetical protein